MTTTRTDERRTSRPWRLVGAAVATLGALYWTAVRPWHRTWGATADEVGRPLPGDQLVPSPDASSTHAIRIHAPAEEVWPWLVQLGQGRGGFYSYDWLENLVGADVHNADRIVPEYQELAVGDVVRLAPENYVVAVAESAPLVAQLDPERALVLRSPTNPPTWTWAFVLEPVDEGTTRLVVRTRSLTESTEDVLTQVLFWEPAQFVMERKMLQGIKERVEATAPARRVAGQSTTRQT